MTGAELRQTRQAMGFSLNAFAEHLGYNERTIRRWERGEWEIPKIVVLYLCGTKQTKESE